MIVYPEITEIAETVEKANKLIDEFVKKYDEICEGLDWGTAKFVKLNAEYINSMCRQGGETDDYYVDQTHGYHEDNFYGHVYFKTADPNKFVDVVFEC